MKTFIVIALGVLAVVGEISCIYKFVTSDFEPSYKREVIYGIGMVTGVGAIIGYMDIEDVKTK